MKQFRAWRTIEGLRRSRRVLDRQISSRTAELKRLNDSLLREIAELKCAEKELHLLIRIILDIAAAADVLSCIEVALHRIAQATGWEYGEAWIPRPDGSAADCSPAWYGSGEQARQFRALSECYSFTPGVGLVGRVWASGRLEWIEDLSRTPEHLRSELAEDLGLKAAVGVPILSHGKVLAILAFFFSQSRLDISRHIVSAVATRLGPILERKQEEEALHRIRNELETRVGERTAELARANEALQVEIAERRRVEDEIKARVHQQAAVAKLGERALAGAEISALLHEACLVVGQTLAVELSGVLTVIPDGNALRLEAGTGWESGSVGRATVSADIDSPAGYALASGASVVIEDAQTDSHFRLPPLLQEHRVMGSISVVISGHDRPFGVLEAHTLRRRRFSIDDVHFLEAVAHVLSAAIERKKSEGRLRESREELRALALRLQAVREDERTALARDIHDQLSGALTALKMELSLLEHRLKDDAGLTEKIGAMGAFIDTTLRSVRNIVSQLRPGVLDDLGLIAAIEWELDEFQRRSAITCECELPHRDPSLHRDQSTAVFRILQEALTNVARHAEANRVWVRLRHDSDTLVLEIQDNGRGVAPEEVSSSKSFGLIGMRERALAFGGQVIIDGEPTRGTTVTLRLPLWRAPAKP